MCGIMGLRPEISYEINQLVSGIFMVVMFYPEGSGYRSECEYVAM